MSSSSPIRATPIELPLPGGQDGASVALQPLLCAEMRGPEGWFHAEGGPLKTLHALGIGVAKEALWPIPVVAFLIEHPTAGAILIDTGFHRAVADGSLRERARNLGPIGLGMVRDVRIGPRQTAAEQLQARGIAPADVRLIVMTHLHFDHASALADFPGATAIVSHAEWRAARGRAAPLGGYSAGQLDPRLNYRTVDFGGPAARPRGPFARSLDLLGDGSLILLDTPGHSAGHLSVLARLSEREALIAGDAIYTLATLREGKRPLRSADGKAFERSLSQLQAYDREHPDALIVPGHDMAHWQTLAERYV